MRKYKKAISTSAIVDESWTLAQAIAAQEGLSLTASPNSPLNSWARLRKKRRLERFQELADGGSGVAVLKGIQECIDQGIPISGPLGQLFATRFLVALKKNSWDAAFGTPYPK